MDRMTDKTKGRALEIKGICKLEKGSEMRAADNETDNPPIVPKKMVEVVCLFKISSCVLRIQRANKGEARFPYMKIIENNKLLK